ncbi:hypothetical protein ACTXT7_001695 [Hymenolepis weldensis]
MTAAPALQFALTCPEYRSGQKLSWVSGVSLFQGGRRSHASRLISIGSGFAFVDSARSKIFTVAYPDLDANVHIVQRGITPCCDDIFSLSSLTRDDFRRTAAVSQIVLIEA